MSELSVIFIEFCEVLWSKKRHESSIDELIKYIETKFSMEFESGW